MTRYQQGWILSTILFFSGSAVMAQMIGNICMANRSGLACLRPESGFDLFRKCTNSSVPNGIIFCGDIEEGPPQSCPGVAPALPDEIGKEGSTWPS